MTVLVVDLAQLRAATSRLDAFGREVAECLEGAEHIAAVLRASWQGEASDAQARAQRQWEDGAEQMKASLSALQIVADAAHRNYSAAVSANGQMWRT